MDLRNGICSSELIHQAGIREQWQNSCDCDNEHSNIMKERNFWTSEQLQASQEELCYLELITAFDFDNVRNY
jgi:hypothetical protein